MNEMKDRLIEGALRMGLSLDLKMVDQMIAYLERVLLVNRTMNLTRITDPAEAVDRHLLDSLTLLAQPDAGIWLPKGGRFADVGCGAGFPGVPIAIARPDARGFLFDALRKKIDFVGETCASLRIDAHCAHGRAEDFGGSAEHRECYDLVIARAVAATAMLCEWALPLVRVGGYAIFYKGPAARAELNSALSACTRLGGGEPRILSVRIPGTELNHALVVIPKVRPTPPHFPRNPAQARGMPLA